MTVPIKNKIDAILSNSRDNLVSNLKNQGLEDGKNTITFDTVLKEAVSSAPSLDKEHINMILFMMKMQMNERLFRVVTDDNKGSHLYKPLLGMINKNIDGYLPEPTASKIQRQPQNNDDNSPNGDIDAIIGQAAERFNVDSDLIRGVIKAESNFKAHSTSSKGAMGLMQLMPATARDLGVKDPYDPYENVMGGTRYLKGLLNRYSGDVDRALAAYNWGMGNVEKHPDRLPRETRTYISRIKQYYFEAKA